MSRAPKQPIIYQEKLNLSPEIIRFATPKEPAIYRAEKLKCNSLVEIGAGIGGQTLAFAKTCKKVLAIEINKKDAEILKENLEKLKIKNVELIVGDALSKEVITKVEKFKPEIIFCDTARKPEGERLIKDIEPDIKKLLKEYSKITKKIAIEIPPFTKDIDSLKEEFEKEFISLDKKLNRLTLYFNELKEVETSVISLPKKEKITSEKIETKVNEANSILNFSYLYEIDPALTLAKLENELASSFELEKIKIENKEYFLSKKPYSSEFLSKYKILAVCENKFEEIIKNLNLLKSKKVILKFNISPENYWKERKKYEEKLLTGELETYLFTNKNQAIIAKKVQ